MLLFKSNLFVILFVLSAAVGQIRCQSNDTEITTESTFEGDGNEESDEKSVDMASSAAPKEQPSSSTSPKSEETRTQPPLTDVDNIKDDDSPSAANKEDNEFTGNENDDSSLFSISPSASSAPPSDKSGDSEANDGGDDGASSPAPKSSTSEQPKSGAVSKQSYEECVALGNENCGTPPDDLEEEKEIKDDALHVKPSESNSNNNSNSNSVIPANNDINDENKSEEAQEQKSKHLW